jgi:hypothetical protein
MNTNFSPVEYYKTQLEMQLHKLENQKIISIDDQTSLSAKVNNYMTAFIKENRMFIQPIEIIEMQILMKRIRAISEKVESEPERKEIQTSKNNFLHSKL